MNGFKIFAAIAVACVASATTANAAVSGCHRPGYPVPPSGHCKCNNFFPKLSGTYCCDTSGSLSTSGTSYCK